MRVQELRGMQTTMAEKLVAAGIKSSDDLLTAGKTPAGRKDLAARVGADPKEVLEMLNRANLARVQGIGEVYSNLLENAGVDTVAELSKRVRPISMPSLPSRLRRATPAARPRCLKLRIG